MDELLVLPAQECWFWTAQRSMVLPVEKRHGNPWKGHHCKGLGDDYSVWIFSNLQSLSCLFPSSRWDTLENFLSIAEWSMHPILAIYVGLLWPCSADQYIVSWTAFLWTTMLDSRKSLKILQNDGIPKCDQHELGQSSWVLELLLASEWILFT